MEGEVSSVIVNDAPTTRGRHALKWVLGVEAKGFQPFEAHVDVKSGERTPVVVRLEPK